MHNPSPTRYMILWPWVSSHVHAYNLNPISAVSELPYQSLGWCIPQHSYSPQHVFDPPAAQMVSQDVATALLGQHSHQALQEMLSMCMRHGLVHNSRGRAVRSP